MVPHRKKLQVITQALLSRPLLTEKQSNRLISHLCGEEVNNEDTGKIMREISSRLNVLGFEIITKRFGDDGEIYTAIVANTKAESEKIEERSTPVTHDELFYVKRIIAAIQDSEDGHCSLSDLSNMSIPKMHSKDSDTKIQQRYLNVGQIDRLIRFLDSRGYLIISHDGLRSNVALGVRTVFELGQLVPQQLQNIRTCAICKDPVFQGDSCPSEDCQATLHFRCKKVYFEKMAGRKCIAPDCEQEWEEKYKADCEPEEPPMSPLRVPAEDEDAVGDTEEPLPNLDGAFPHLEPMNVSAVQPLRRARALADESSEDEDQPRRRRRRQ